MPANRIQVYHDFGYVALDILSVRDDDAGVYTVVARNALGEAQAQATMIVESKFFYFFVCLRVDNNFAKQFRFNSTF